MYDYNCPDCNEAKLQSDKNARKINEIIGQFNQIVDNDIATTKYLLEKADEIVGKKAKEKVNEELNGLNTEVDNIQQQVNNLVLGAVGDGNNAEVVQARGSFTVLNDRLDDFKNNITHVSKSVYIKDEKRDIISLDDFESGKYYSLWENQISTPPNDGYCIAQPIEIKSGIYTFKSISTVFSFIKVDGLFISLKEILGEYDLGKIIFAYLPTCELYITSLISENNYAYQGKPTVYNYLNTDIHVAQDFSKDVPNIKFAIDMIVDNTVEWNIIIHKGVYYENSLEIPNNVNLINPSGDYNDVEIRGELDDYSLSADITDKSTIDLHWSNRIENIKITAKNLRYPIHSESGGRDKDWKQIIKNCYLEHYGNPSPNSQWTSYHAWGEGASSGAYAYFEDCYFKSPTEPWYIHEAQNQEKPYLHELKNCVMECTDYAYGRACVIDNTRENTVINTVKFEDCTFIGSLNVNGTFPVDVELKNCGDVLINCDNDGNKFSNNHYPIEKNRIRKAIYKGTTPLVGGEVIASGDVFGQVKLADSNTPVEQIVGIALGSANPEDLITIITGGIFYCDKGWSGNKISAGENGTISENGSNVFAIGLGYNYARLINK